MTFAIAGIPPGVERPGSCGKLLPFLSLKVIDPETGKSLEAKQVGEICFKVLFKQSLQVYNTGLV